MQKDINLSVVVPVYKNAATIPELHARLGKISLDYGWKMEVIYVNDASPDQSAEVIKKLPDYPGLTLLNLNKNMGQSTALLCGMALSKYDLIVTMDADLQDEPETLPLMLQNLTAGKDVVFALRSGAYENGAKLLTSYLFKSLVSLLSLGRIPRFAGLYLIIRKDAVQSLLPYISKKPYIIGLIAKHHFKCAGYETIRKRNHLNETSYTLKKRLKVAFQFFKTMFMKPSLTIEGVSKWLDLNTTINNK